MQILFKISSHLQFILKLKIIFLAIGAVLKTQNIKMVSLWCLS